MLTWFTVVQESNQDCGGQHGGFCEDGLSLIREGIVW